MVYVVHECGRSIFKNDRNLINRRTIVAKHAVLYHLHPANKLLLYDAGKVCNRAHCSELVADNLFERRKQKEQVKRTQEGKRKKPGEVRRCPQMVLFKLLRASNAQFLLSYVCWSSTSAEEGHGGRSDRAVIVHMSRKNIQISNAL